MTTSAAIYGCAGTTLSAAERSFFRDADPFGFILFARNVATPEQVRALVADLRASVGRADAPVLIDQEGGRVRRLRPPHWRASPPASAFAALYARDHDAAVEASRLNGRLLAAELLALGIDVDCAPVLDVPVAGAHDVIGDRAFGHAPEPVIALGGAQAEGLLAGGVMPVAKHIPGHGRAMADSHLELPVVDASLDELRASDFAPFRALADIPWGMTAHVLYRALASNRPATTSERIVADVIRGWIGFDGFLLSDDLSMKALGGSFGERARLSLDAGCDAVLHCNGRMEEMTAIADAVAPLSSVARIRLDRANARRAAAFDHADAATLARHRYRLAVLLDGLV